MQVAVLADTQAPRGDMSELQSLAAERCRAC